ncbi:phage holin family protein [Riemerella columbipharyngis]|uniref:Putative Holin-X, holin superfamily III n=1 Tax=Riemerella columbipharyngis TaxID=1071918 RepID=A0A1G6YGB3_9FLAO|nr:phage holin family protein [Riemerella columbipharyngis]SDD89321.1 Putative Holin-X, holin superfamily III [Riemerella columbipharyngis]
MFNIFKDYISKKIELAKLEAKEKMAEKISGIVFAAIMAMMVLLFSIMVNIGLALLIGSYLAKISYGFLIVSGGHILLLLIFILAKKSVKSVLANIVFKILNK